MNYKTEKEMSEKKYFLINQINVNAIFSIVGSYGKPFLRVKGGFADMSNGEFTEINSSQDSKMRCKVLSEVELAAKYNKRLNWVEVWKEEIKRLVEKERK